MIGHAARSAAASEWLAQAHPFPPQVKEEWSDPQRGVALIPTGHTFDTVRVAAHLVHAAADSSNEAAVAGFLSALVDGPIIHDAYSATSAYYFLVPLGSCAHHLTPDAQLLAPGVTWLGVPHLSRTARPGSFWVLAPRQRDDLCIPGYVDQLIRAGRKRLAEPPPELPGMDRIEAECRALTDPEGPADPSFEDAHLLLLRLRGYLLQLVPAVEERADRREPMAMVSAV
ncbi:hypothetical protein ABZ404_39130 [Streptomyces sp. NPDC005878]|uniref:hypothetical protein n=1 Tax=Streptomyces sp. NPDC005878 TaxID=3157077 RepID=UPI0033C45047